MSVEALPIDCPNCGSHLEGDYCHACGQKRTAINPTVREVVTELAESVTSIDGRLIGSLKLLFTSPGQLTRELFAGHRARYVTPLRLYLTFSVFYFAVSAVIPSPTQAFNIVPASGSGLHAGVRVSGGGFQAGVTVPGDAQASEQKSEAEVAQEREFERRANAALVVWTPRLMFVLVPLFAVFLGMTVRKTGHHYPQHLFMALHLHSAWFFIAAIATGTRLLHVPALSSVAGLIGVSYGAVYFVLAIRRTYQTSVVGALWRAAGVAVVYFITVVTMLVGVALPAMFWGQ